jgi:protein-L-isoaspartate(D-aspartate) O-methyltransferase
VGERQVHAVEIDRGLVYEARENLATADQSGVLVDRGDGAEGLPDYAPFDRILVEAAAVEVPAALRRQLASGGRVVFPRGNGPDQRLVAVDAAGETVADGGPVGFAPLLVEGEQRGAVERNRTHREDRERAARAAESRAGWEQEWIDWERR